MYWFWKRVAEKCMVAWAYATVCPLYGMPGTCPSCSRTLSYVNDNECVMKIPCETRTKGMILRYGRIDSENSALRIVECFIFKCSLRFRIVQINLYKIFSIDSYIRNRKLESITHISTAQFPFFGQNILNCKYAHSVSYKHTYRSSLLRSICETHRTVFVNWLKYYKGWHCLWYRMWIAW